jgi:uncharacterized protein with PQ loop repeat
MHVGLAMTSHDLWVGLGYLGALLGVVMVVPQIVRVVRHPSLPGVSPTSWALTSLACLAWMTYGIRNDAAPQIPGNVLLVSGAVAVVLLANAPMPRGRRGLLLGLGAGALSAIAWSIPADSVGYFAFGVGLFSSWPQLYDSIGSWRARISSGVSVSAWTLRVGSQVAWLAYAIGTHSLPVGIAASVTMASAIATVALERGARMPSVGAVVTRPAADAA